ncbi:MAG TPA: VWA domain-containing protein [Pyrinomonadaceae bacterium]|jgi:VWFA-related protein|nr:VWA domain-containing protein [Pyrinomonadaceae bacterium]
MCNSLPARLSLACAALACFVGTLFTALAQTQRPGDQQDRIVISKDEVLFDVVVRDKRGKIIKDLTEADFEVYEDGVKQDINSFRFVASIAAESVATSPNSDKKTTTDPVVIKNPGATTEETTGVSALALVFDRLSPESRPRAREAALSYLGESIKKNDLVGVFLTDLSVMVLQPFTSDSQQIKAAIEKAGVHAPSLYTSNNEQARAARNEVTVGLLRASQAGEAPPLPGTEFNAPTAQVALSMLEFLEETQRDQQGNATTHGLLHIASSLRALPGRKAVIFFSEGLVLPPNVQEAFRSVINEANRGNVSFYAVDVAGLRVESKTAETRREISSRSDLRMAQMGSNAELNGPMTKGLERNEDLLRLNPDSGLQRLANDTGGFLITDSNDLAGRLQKVDEDLHSYYLLSYSSNNQKYDGHFRQIEVKLKRSGLSVQSRKGYYAIKGKFGSPVLSYEAPALAVLDNNPKPDSFPFYVGGFSFPDRERQGLAPVIVDAPLSAFTIHVDQAKKLYDTDFSIVNLLKDQTGQVVAKFSSQYKLTGPSDKVEDARKERILFYREANLPPGRYTLETIAYDAPSGRASVRSANIEVTATDASRFRLSDVVFLKRAEQVGTAEESMTNPFRVANMIVHPNLGEPIQRSLKQVPFYFTVYVPAGSSNKPKLTIELLSQGQTLAQMPGELPESDALGRSQFVSGLPVEKMPAGNYELRITVSGEAMSLSRSRKFTIVD